MLHNVHAHIAHNAHSEAPKSSFGSSEQPVPVFLGSFCPGKRRKLEILSENLNIHNPERARWHKWGKALKEKWDASVHQPHYCYRL